MLQLSLKGSWYEIGFQHGEQLQCLIQGVIRKRCRFFGKDAKPNIPRIRERARKLASEFPEVIEEWTGIADGAKCSLDDVLVLNLGPMPGSCSNLVLLCEDGPALGHVDDDQGAGVFDVAFHIQPSDGRGIWSLGTAGHVWTSAAMNDDGLAVSHSAARSADLRNPGALLNYGILLRLLVQRNGDCRQVEDFLRKWACVSGADNIIAVDREGAAFVAEKPPTAVAFRRPEKGAIYCTNRTLSREIRDIMNQDVYEQTAKEIPKLINRERYFKELIAKNANCFSLDLLKQAMRCADEGVGICNELSNWAAILLPRRFEVLLADKYPCDNEFAMLR